MFGLKLNKYNTHIYHYYFAWFIPWITFCMVVIKFFFLIFQRKQLHSLRASCLIKSTTILSPCSMNSLIIGAVGIPWQVKYTASASEPDTATVLLYATRLFMLKIGTDNPAPRLVGVAHGLLKNYKVLTKIKVKHDSYITDSRTCNIWVI